MMRALHCFFWHKGEFDCQKRVPKGDNEESFPPLRVLKLPKEGLEKEEIPEEIIEIEDKENIVWRSHLKFIYLCQRMI